MHILNLSPEIIIHICRSMPIFSMSRIDLAGLMGGDFMMRSEVMLRGLREAKLNGRVDVSYLSRTCKRMRGIVEPELYRSITLTSTRSVSANTNDKRTARERLNGRVIAALISTLQQRPALVEYIQELDFDENGPNASELTILCTRLRVIKTTRSKPLGTLPHPELINVVHLLDDGRTKRGPLLSVDWSRFTNLSELELVLRSMDMEDRDAVSRIKEIFGNGELKKLILKSCFDIFEARDPLSFEDLLAFVGPKTEILDIEDMDLPLHSVFPSGLALIDVSLGKGCTSADYSALASVRILRLTEQDTDTHTEERLLLPCFTKLPPNLQALHLHSTDKPFLLDQDALSSLQTLFADAKAARHGVCTLLYAGDEYEAQEKYCSAETLENLADLCDQYSVELGDFEEEDSHQGTREWLRIQFA